MSPPKPFTHQSVRLRDEVDRELLRQYAWRTSVAPETEKPAAPEPDPKTEEETDAIREVITQVEGAIDRVWAMQAGDAQDRATRALVEMLHKLGGYAGWIDCGTPSVRLGRLIARAAAAWSGEEQQQAAEVLVVQHWPKGHAELETMVVELLRARSGIALVALELSCARSLGNVPAPLAEMARLLETEPVEVRRHVLIWLRNAGEAAAPVLRRTLRTPSLSDRVHALLRLVALGPPSLQADDVRWLFEDALVHPLPRGFDDTLVENRGVYSTLLLEALRLTRPPGLEPVLDKLARAEGASIWGERGELHEGFGLAALAAVAPERALPEIDRRLESEAPSSRGDAAQALAMVPWALAKERTVVLAADADPETAELARTAWLEHEQSPCPVPRDAGPFAKLLRGRPSADFTRRLAALDGPAESRAVLGRLLLAERPRRENLVLLLRLLDGTLPANAPSQTEWARLLHRRFGNAGLQGLLLLFASHPRAMKSSWLLRVAEVVRRRRGLDPVRRRVRALALERLASGREVDVDIAVRTLRQVGAGRGAWKPLFALLCASKDHEPLVQWLDLQQALAELGPCRALDDALERTMRERLHRGDIAGTGALLWTALRRSPERAAPLLFEAVERLDGSAVHQWHGVFALALEKRRFSTSLVRSWLERPERPAFDFFVALLRLRAPESWVVRARKALDSPARDTRAAVAAAQGLLQCSRHEGLEDRIPPLLEGPAPVDRRIQLLEHAIDRLGEAPCLPALRRLLETTDGEALSSVVLLASGVRSLRRDPEMLALATARAPTVELRQEIAMRLDRETDEQRWWTDPIQRRIRIPWNPYAAEQEDKPGSDGVFDEGVFDED